MRFLWLYYTLIKHSSLGYDTKLEFPKNSNIMFDDQAGRI
jgi:hypothetical protein